MTPAHAKGISLRFKIRCSAIGKIMTNGRGIDSLGETAKNYALNWILEQPEFLGVQVNEFSSKHTRKGNAVEADALDLIGQVLYNGAYLVPNKERKSNDFMTGTPDVVLDDHIIDNKASWSANSFPFFKTAPETDYWWQGQGYMHLFGKNKYKVIHTLMDTPEALINREAWKIANELGIQEPTDEIIESVTKRMTFSHLPIEKRIKGFEFQYDDQAIQKVKKRVDDIREFIYTTLNESKKQNQITQGAELF